MPPARPSPTIELAVDLLGVSVRVSCDDPGLGELLEACHRRGIWITAYSPVARGEVMKNEKIRTIASAHGVGPAAVAIAWLVAKSAIVIPKASSDEHLRDNLAAADLELAPSEIEAIDNLGVKKRLVDGSWKHYPFD